MPVTEEDVPASVRDEFHLGGEEEAVEEEVEEHDVRPPSTKDMVQAARVLHKGFLSIAQLDFDLLQAMDREVQKFSLSGLKQSTIDVFFRRDS